MRTAFNLALLLTACTASSQYNSPESVEYDTAGDRYFVSNTGDNTIKQRDQAGAVTAFVSVSPAPYGLEIQGDTLFACSGGSVKGYSLSSAALVFNLNLGGTFLNGITSDGTHIYVTDFSAKRIHKIDPALGTSSILVNSTVFTPNGIVYDPADDRLVVVAWGSNAAITAVDKNSGAMTTLSTTNLTNIDGVTIDCDGHFIVASWSPDRLTRYEPSFTLPGVIVPATGLNNPADIDFDPLHGTVCVPNANGNSVSLVPVAECTVGVAPVMAWEEFQVFPNPAEAIIRVALGAIGPVPYLLMDAKGLMVGGGVLPVGGLLDIEPLRSGTYVLSIPGLRKLARFVRE